MLQQMPQEIEVWYIIPAIRRELAKVIVKDYGLSQKECAAVLGITEAAVSQYLKLKRAKEVTFGKKTIVEIKKAAKRIIDEKELRMEEIYKLTSMVKVTKLLCDIHRDHDKGLPAKCDICLK
jgi:uncharacterized protein